MEPLTSRELRLLRYSLGFLQSELDADLQVEVAQEMAPETQATGEPLPNVRDAIRDLQAKLGQRLDAARP
jgi:hypothetical protein